MSPTSVRNVPLTDDHLPAALDCWEAHRRRNAGADATWARPIADRRQSVRSRLRGILREGGGRSWARAAIREGDGALLAFLAGAHWRLSPDTPYRAYAPDSLIGIGADGWAVGEAADVPLLAGLYAELAVWGVGRGADAQQLGIPAGDDCTELWSDLGFARHDCYAALPVDAVPSAGGGLAVRRATPGDLDVAAAFAAGEAGFHHQGPVFAFAPPRRDAALRRDLRESLADGDPDELVLLAERAGTPVGFLHASFLPNLPSWAPSALPTPSLFIASAFVAPEARGGGVLRGLVAEGARLAAARRAASLFVTFLPANLLAARAWQGLGFRPLLTIHQRALDPRVVRQLRDELKADRAPL